MNGFRACYLLLSLGLTFNTFYLGLSLVLKLNYNLSKLHYLRLASNHTWLTHCVCWLRWSGCALLTSLIHNLLAWIGWSAKDDTSIVCWYICCRYWSNLNFYLWRLIYFSRLDLCKLLFLNFSRLTTWKQFMHFFWFVCFSLIWEWFCSVMSRRNPL